MSISISWTRTGQILIGNVVGRVNSQNANVFNELIEAVEEPDNLNMILDFSSLSFISSAGLRILLLTARKYQESDIQFGLCALPDTIEELMEISGFDKIVQIYSSRAESIQSITGQPVPEADSTAPAGGTKEHRDISFQGAVHRGILQDRLPDILAFTLQKYENTTGTSVPPEKIEEVNSQMCEGLNEVVEEIRKVLRESKKDLYRAADRKLEEIINR